MPGGGLWNFKRNWTFKADFICSYLTAMCAHMLYSHTGDPSYIIDVLVSMELQML